MVPVTELTFGCHIFVTNFTLGSQGWAGVSERLSAKSGSPSGKGKWTEETAKNKKKRVSGPLLRPFYGSSRSADDGHMPTAASLRPSFFQPRINKIKIK
jgi:hypothetical protein